MSGSSQYRFGVLAKIVKFMRTRHQDGDDHPLTIEEILDETNQLDIGQSVKNVSCSCYTLPKMIIYYFTVLVACQRGSAQQSKGGSQSLWHQV